MEILTMAIRGGDTVPDMAGEKRTKRIDSDALEHFGRELGRWVQEAHAGNQTAAGRALGLSQGHISAMIAGVRGPGLPTLIALREKTGRSIDDLLGLGPLPARPAVNARLPAELPDGVRVVDLLRQALALEEGSAPPPRPAPEAKSKREPEQPRVELPKPKRRA